MRYLRATLLLLGVLVCGGSGAAAPAAGKVTLGPDVLTPPPSGGFTFGAVGCQKGPYSPCLYLDMESTNPAIPVVSPIDGVITKWRFRAGCCTEAQTETKALTLVTFAKGPSFGYPSGVVQLRGASYELRPGDQLLSSAPPELPARLPIKAGERFGIVADEPIAFAVDATLGGVTSAVMMNGVEYQGQRYGSAVNAAIMMSVDIEPDADGDGYGDETQDCKPADPAVAEGPGCDPPPPVVQLPIPNPLSVGIACGGPAGPACPPLTAPTPPVTSEAAAPPPPPIALARIIGSVPASTDGTRFTVSLSCPASAGGPCTGVLVIDPAGGSKARRLAATAPARRSYGTVTYSVAPGKTAALVVRLNRAGRAALKKRRKLTVALVLQPTGGTTTRVTRTLRAAKGRGR